MNKLYLKPWDYNKEILLDMLDKYVVENGGSLHGYYRPGTIIRSDHNGHEFGSTETNHCDTFGSYSSFVLNGEYFYVELDCNPFFDFHCSRIPLNSEGKYIGNYYSSELKKDWIYDCMFSHKIKESELNEVFKQFLNAVLIIEPSKRYYERKKVRVSNIYDGGYHYEWIDKSDKSIHSPSERREICY